MAKSFYSRRNSYAVSPGVWFTDDGEYELYRDGKVWTVKHRAHFDETTRQHTSLIIGQATTLQVAWAIAAKHYMTPVGQWTFEVPSEVLNVRRCAACDAPATCYGGSDAFCSFHMANGAEAQR